MAYIASAFTAGQTLTAASMEDLRGNANAGHNVFTTEAARDAAITAPTEGMMAYLTAPTVPAATGATTAVPTGVTTVYNGSVWVCVTPVGALSNTSATTTSGTFVTTLTGDSTAISVTTTTGTTATLFGQVVISLSGAATPSAAVSVSGATTISAASSNFESRFAHPNGSYQYSFPLIVLATGLTAGTNTFTLNYSVSGGVTATFIRRNLIVQGIA